MRVNLVQESARHLQMTRVRKMRVDTRDLPEAKLIKIIKGLNFVCMELEGGPGGLVSLPNIQLIAKIFQRIQEAPKSSKVVLHF